MSDLSSENVRIASVSGEVNINSKLVSFLYELMRDHLPPGVIEEIVRNSQESNVNYCNGWLAKYSEYLANRLR